MTLVSEVTWPRSNRYPAKKKVPLHKKIGRRGGTHVVWGANKSLTKWTIDNRFKYVMYHEDLSNSRYKTAMHVFVPVTQINFLSGNRIFLWHHCALGCYERAYSSSVYVKPAQKTAAIRSHNLLPFPVASHFSRALSIVIESGIDCYRERYRLLSRVLQR